ncbi:hypothetical protein BU202_00810 [Streptococcus cuniculi]|uniref:PrgI family protein n=1 Tax=Streptococcus cuniculi TaxID=1432788 RepID=A0A1Q8EAP8_9STRE|nr:hypothetical protein [Streptococcus cuniculi]OLF48861.1 hypothetical protein BU202_00810 [Streptococcus cuniculi]
MNKLGSIFLDDFIKEEKPILFQLTGRGLLLVFGGTLTLGVTTLLFFFDYPDWLVFVVAASLFSPTMIIGLSIDKRFSFSERFYFFLLTKRRIYQIEHRDRKEYRSSDFIQAKNVRETDQI